MHATDRLTCSCVGPDINAKHLQGVHLSLSGGGGSGGGHPTIFPASNVVVVMAWENHTAAARLYWLSIAAAKGSLRDSEYRILSARRTASLRLRAHSLAAVAAAVDIIGSAVSHSSR